MRVASFEKRIELAEEAAKSQSKFPPDCICFPADEQPFFGFPLEEQIAAKVRCPLHGDRSAPSFYIYVPKWRRENEKTVRWFRLSPQYHKAWQASFPPELWPAQEEEDSSGQLYLRLKDGSKILV